MRANEVADRLFLIETGFVDYYVSTEDGREILLRRLAAGDVFGVASFLSKPIGLAKTYPQPVENALRTALPYLAQYAKRHIGLVSNTAQESSPGT